MNWYVLLDAAIFNINIFIYRRKEPLFMKFEQLNIIEPILKALKEQGYVKPTPIQEKALPPALEGRDVLGCAQTGTGKTCAFAVPILQRLNARPMKEHPIRALVLTPTRELAIQNQECFEAYGKYLSLRSTVIFGGVGQAPQVEALKKGTDILVATPGRLQDLHDQGLVNVDKLEILVLDEADRMLDMGFIHDVKRILAWLPKKKQTLFFSATMPEELRGLVNSLLHDPVKIAVDPVSSPVEKIEQRVYFVDKNNKTNLLVHLLEQEQVSSALVFTRTKHGANKVSTELKRRGVNAEAIHGNKSQTARQNALSGFKEGTVRVLVATDIAARGLDIEELPFVFNYNLPDVPETYIHRIGRTGRAGREGIAISFCDISEVDLLKGIEKLIGRKVPVVEDHPYPMVVLEAPVKDKKGRVVNPEDKEAREAAQQKRRERSAAGRASEKNTGKEETPVAEQKRSKSSTEKSQSSSQTKKKSQPRSEKQQDMEQNSEKYASRKSVQDSQIMENQPFEEDDEENLPTALRSKSTWAQHPSYNTHSTRLGSLDEFLKEISDEEETEDGEYDYSDFPLLEQKLREEKKDSQYLDATERMFATHSSKYRDAYDGGKKKSQKKQDASKDKKNTSGKSGRTDNGTASQKKASKNGEKQQSAKKNTQKQASGSGQSSQKKDAKQKSGSQSRSGGNAQKGKKTAESRQKQNSGQTAKKGSGNQKSGSNSRAGKQQNSRKKSDSQAQNGQVVTVKKRKNRDYRTPPPMERSHYATQKDSTEQQSLMKPYYINDKKED